MQPAGRRLKTIPPKPTSRLPSVAGLAAENPFACCAPCVIFNLKYQMLSQVTSSNACVTVMPVSRYARYAPYARKAFVGPALFKLGVRMYATYPFLTLVSQGALAKNDVVHQYSRGRNGAVKSGDALSRLARC